MNRQLAERVPVQKETAPGDEAFAFHNLQKELKREREKDDEEVDGGAGGAGRGARGGRGRVTQQQRKVEWKSTKQSERERGEMRDGR